MNPKVFHGHIQTYLIQATLVVLLICVIGLSGLASYLTFRQLALDAPNAGRALLPIFSTGKITPEINPANTSLPGDLPITTDPSFSQPELTPWDGAGRVTILLLGLDYRDWSQSEGASRSDTMMLLTLDPLTKTAGILSIPRDLWVSIPGFKHGKINTAYYLGDAYKLPGGGPGLAVETVEQLLGVPIHYYAQIDFNAFVRFIDEIGGVKIDVPEAITVDLIGSGYQTKKTLKPGRQVLPGAWALAYARARYTQGGDFDRAGRQQQVILAIRDRILRWKMLPTLVTKAPSLYKELSSGIRTNLSLDDAIKLAVSANEIPEKNIKRGLIDKGNVHFGFSPDGLSILIPIPDEILELRDNIFASSGSLAPLTEGGVEKKMQAENAKIGIYNGSNSQDLAIRTADYLSGVDANITIIGDADQSYANTVVIDHTGNPYTLAYLKDILRISPYRIYIEFDPSSPIDVKLFLGNDWAANNLLP